MNDAQTLQGYLFRLRELKVLDAQLRQLRQAMKPAGCTTQGEVGQRRSTNEPQAALRQRMDSLERQMMDCQCQLTDSACRCEAILQAQSDPRLRTILRMYYALGKHDAEIAAYVHLSTRTVNHLRNQWLRSVQ